MSVGTGQVSMEKDKRIALRMRQLLSGHINTWVMLEGTKIPSRNWSDRFNSRSRTVYLRVEEYVGQYSEKHAGDTRKRNIRDARDSALVLEVIYDAKGRCRVVKANGIKLTNDRGWFAYRMKQVIGGLVAEVDLLMDNLEYREGSGKDEPDPIPRGITRIIDHGADEIGSPMVSYIRRREFIYDLTDRINRRGASGQIHISEPTSARHSAYPGW